MTHLSRSLITTVALLTLFTTAPGQDTPPSIKYGPSRESKDWIETRRGKEAVDTGVTWQGVTVYLSLMWDLIAVDAETKKVLWSEDVGAFWNEVGFKEMPAAGGAKTWAVELRPGENATADVAALRQYHDLRTGKKIGVEDAPSGHQHPIPHQWSGHVTAIKDRMYRLVGSEADWKASVLEPMFSGVKDVPAFGTIDFEKNVVVVIATGETCNCNGIEATAWENGERILLRLRLETFQTCSAPNDPDAGKYDHMRPYGVFVLPRTNPLKPIIVEKNHQNLIGGPPLWKELCRFEALGEGKAASRPAKQRAR